MHDGNGVVEIIPAGFEQESVEGNELRPSWRVIAMALLILGGRALVWLVRQPVRIGGRFVALTLRWYVHSFVQASTRAKCPSCGVRAEHDVRFSEMLERLVHVCKRCHAVWSEPPMVQFAAWRTQVVATEDDGSTMSHDGVRNTTVQHAQREPQIVPRRPGGIA